jgi:hypothetical protein
MRYEVGSYQLLFVVVDHQLAEVDLVSDDLALKCDRNGELLQHVSGQ